MSTAFMLILAAAQLGGVAVLPTAVPVTQSSCNKLLTTTLTGMGESFKNNATGAHKDIQMTQEGQWMVLRTPMGREIARGTCT